MNLLPEHTYVFYEPHYSHLDFKWASGAARPGRAFESLLAFLHQASRAATAECDTQAMYQRFGRIAPRLHLSPSEAFQGSVLGAVKQTLAQNKTSLTGAHMQHSQQLSWSEALADSLSVTLQAAMATFVQATSTTHFSGCKVADKTELGQEEAQAKTTELDQVSQEQLDITDAGGLCVAGYIHQLPTKNPGKLPAIAELARSF
jgi:hypothetical protein